MKSRPVVAVDHWAAFRILPLPDTHGWRIRLRRYVQLHMLQLLAVNRPVPLQPLVHIVGNLILNSSAINGNHVLHICRTKSSRSASMPP